MYDTRLLAIASVAVLLSGCPLVMGDDYVIQSVVIEETDAEVDAGGFPSDAPVCVTKTCPALGARCGTAPDGCGGMLDCGTCKGNEICGIKMPNRCARDTESGR